MRVRVLRHIQVSDGEWRCDMRKHASNSFRREYHGEKLRMKSEGGMGSEERGTRSEG